MILIESDHSIAELLRISRIVTEAFPAKSFFAGERPKDMLGTERIGQDDGERFAVFVPPGLEIVLRAPLEAFVAVREAAVDHLRFVRVRAHGHKCVFHRQIDVGRAAELRLVELFGHDADEVIVPGGRKSTPGAKVGEDDQRIRLEHLELLREALLAFGEDEVSLEAGHISEKGTEVELVYDLHRELFPVAHHFKRSGEGQLEDVAVVFELVGRKFESLQEHDVGLVEHESSELVGATQILQFAAVEAQRHHVIELPAQVRFLDVATERDSGSVDEFHGDDRSREIL